MHVHFILSTSVKMLHKMNLAVGVHLTRPCGHTALVLSENRLRVGAMGACLPPCQVSSRGLVGESDWVGQTRPPPGRSAHGLGMAVGSHVACAASAHAGSVVTENSAYRRTSYQR